MFEGIVGALTALLIIAGPIAVTCAKVVDFIRNLADPSKKFPSWVWNLVAMVIGLGIALLWGVNLLEPVVASIPTLADKAGTQDVMGQVLTGLLIGGMAGFWHDKMAQWAAAHKTLPPPTV